ncbi:MAG: division/cell wall cluster transcriptional repressor MraZ [Acidimicrobiaceae bacterium]|nr:division/cell wall cluster transcriptional repressor MraZ [Acidimicrobiaceae bacterium]
MNPPRTLFVGVHEHTIDGKGRLILPAGFRSHLADGAYVTALDGCVGILPVDEFAHTAEELRSQTGQRLVDINALRSFAAQADFVVPDAQGRMRILPHLRAGAGLDRQVIVTGMIRRIEIWSPERWTEVQSVGTERLAEAITHGRGIASA